MPRKFGDKNKKIRPERALFIKTVKALLRLDPTLSNREIAFATCRTESEVSVAAKQVRTLLKIAVPARSDKARINRALDKVKKQLQIIDGIVGPTSVKE